MTNRPGLAAKCMKTRFRVFSNALKPKAKGFHLGVKYFCLLSLSVCMYKQRQFEDQVDIQMKLEEIALELKQRCSDDQSKMQSLLPELLETHGVPTFTLTPVYNPR